MARTGLVGDEDRSASVIVSQHLAVQGQDYMPTKWSLFLRSRAATSERVDAALADGSIIRTHVMRPTWHLVAAADIHWLMALTGPRVQRGSASRLRELGLDATTLERCADVIVGALQGGKALTRRELADALRSAGEDVEGQRLPWIVSHCELEALIGSGPLRGREHTYALLDERIPKVKRFTPDHPEAELVRRYVDSHGPATVRDMSWWSGLKISDIRSGLEEVGDEVRSFEVDGGLTLWDRGDATPPPVDDRVHLLPAYDEFVVGYTESRFLGDPRLEAMRAAWRDRTLPTGTVLFGTRILGHWRRTISRKIVKVEVATYGSLGRSGKSALEDAVQRLEGFIGLPAEISASVLGG